MTMPVLPFIASPTPSGEVTTHAVDGRPAESFGSLLTSALQLPRHGFGAPQSGMMPNAGLSATSLASVPIVAGAVSQGATAGDPVAFVSGPVTTSFSNTVDPEPLDEGEAMPTAESTMVMTAEAIVSSTDALVQTADANLPAVALDADLPVAFMPVLPGSAPVAAGGIAAPVVGSPNAAATRIRPEFADRLERVVARMESEFGYRVEVVESVRTQSRQDALYAQGRERPGPVVTWTRHSRHTEGFAADVIIDGTYGNASAYRVLAQVAREEGLRTLGPRDPGHIELPRRSQGSASAPDSLAAPLLPRESQSFNTLEPRRFHRVRDVVDSYRNETGKFPATRPQLGAAPVFVPARPVTEAPTVPVVQVAAPARVEPVAAVASVATLAAVPIPGRASPASPNAPIASRDRGTSRRTMEGPVAAETRDLSPAPGVPAATIDEQSTRLAVEPAQGADGDREQHPLAERSEFIEATDLTSPLIGNTETAGRAAPETSRTSADRTISPLLSERITELLNLRDAAAERPLSSVLLRLDSPDGTEDRIRIGLRGNSLDAAFEMTDRVLVDDLSRHLNELARAVERQGFDPERLTARSSGTKDTHLAQAVAGEREGLRAANAGGTNAGTAGSRDGRTARHDAPPDHPPRQRSRREPHGDR